LGVEQKVHTLRGCWGEEFCIYPKWLADAIRWVLIIVTTIACVTGLWKIHWILGLVLGFPALVISVNLWGFLTLRLYDFTIEARNARKRWDELVRGLHSSGDSE